MLNLFQNSTLHKQIGLRLLQLYEFTESIPITDRENLISIKNILETSYTDGITAIKNAGIDANDNIIGEFEDAIAPGQVKRYSFTITDNNISYQLLNSAKVQNFSEAKNLFTLAEWHNFAATKMFSENAKKKKECTKGTPCGKSCIAGGRQCRQATTTAVKKEIQKVKESVKGEGQTPKVSNKTENQNTTKNTTQKTTSETPLKTKKASKAIAATDKEGASLTPAASKNNVELQNAKANFKPLDLGLGFKTSLSDIGTLMSLDADIVFSKNHQKPDAKEVKEFKKKQVNTNPVIVRETGEDKYEAVANGKILASAKEANTKAKVIIVPDDPRQIALAKKLAVPDAVTTQTMMPSEKQKGLTDVGQLYSARSEQFVSDNLNGKKGHGRTDAEVESAAIDLLKAGGRNWVPVLVKNTNKEDQYEVVGNHFAHDVAKKAGVDRIWVHIVG